MASEVTTFPYFVTLKPFLLIGLFLLSVASAEVGEPVNAMCPVTPDEPAESWITTEYEGETIGFCCKSCLRKFNANPEAYLKNLKATSTSHGGEAHTEKADNHDSFVSGDESHLDDGHEHADGAAPSSGNESGEHYHSTDHGSGNGASPTWLITLGKLHVLAVHLPIALLPLAGVLEGIGMFRKSSPLLFAARTNFVVGSFMAIIAASLGWIAADQSNYSRELAELLFLHRWAGVTVAAFAAMGLPLLLSAVRGNSSVGLMLYRIILFLLVALVPVTAHFGGSLIYGRNYLF